MRLRSVGDVCEVVVVRLDSLLIFEVGIILGRSVAADVGTLVETVVGITVDAIIGIALDAVVGEIVLFKGVGFVNV